MKKTPPISLTGCLLGEAHHVCAFFNADEEEYRTNGGRTRQHRGAASCPERRLAATAAKSAGDVAPLALLQQNHQHQHQADENVKNRGQVVQHLLACNEKTLL